MALSADDRFAIQDLLSQYCLHINAMDREAWMKLFEPDGRWLAPWYDLRTKEDFVAHSERRLADPTAGRVQYWVSNVLIKERGDAGTEADVRSDVVRFEGSPDKLSGQVAFMGTYTDVVHKLEDGSWRFKLRSITEQDILVDRARGE